MGHKYDTIIIDVGGRDTASQRAALTISDLFLIPCPPRSLDIWTLNKVVALIDEIAIVNPNLKAYFFINKADHQGKDNQQALDVFKENPKINFLKTSIGNRKSFCNASSLGLSVLEYKPQDKKAIIELKSFVNDIEKIS